MQGLPVDRGVATDVDAVDEDAVAAFDDADADTERRVANPGGDLDAGAQPGHARAAHPLAGLRDRDRLPGSVVEVGVREARIVSVETTPFAAKVDGWIRAIHAHGERRRGANGGHDNEQSVHGRGLPQFRPATSGSAVYFADVPSCRSRAVLPVHSI
ncbi:MAG: hypothetical protein Q8O67_21460 [Deltaproteobacteria bacterium]|nr:hypothetical protein [Deltaproteobacteria bacterium]